jgi:hypothetical protein
VGSGADGQNLNEIDNNNSELHCQTKLPKLPNWTSSKFLSIGVELKFFDFAG